MKYIGKVEIRTLSLGSKSDGEYGYLVCDDGTEYSLCREGVLEMNDPEIIALGGKNVEIEGEATGEWLIINDVVVLDEISETEDEIVENEEDSEEKENPEAEEKHEKPDSEK